MRSFTLPLVAGLLLACGTGGGDSRPGASTMSTGPDPVVVRLPRSGGVARAYRYGALDSTIWRSAGPAPAVERILGFDPENGILAFVDTAGQAGWVDLRLGGIKRPSTKGVSLLTSADGWSIYGIGDKNALVRLTPAGDWQQSMRRGIRRIIPTPDGTVLLVIDAGKGEASLVRMRPPDDAVGDSTEIPLADRAAVTPVGDRVYLGAKDHLLSVSPGDIASVDQFSADDDILAIAPTPSGDRVFIASTGSPRLERLDRYARRVNGSVKLPGLVTELRMDPLGRYLLARPVRGDSAWVVSVASEELVGTVPTAWRPDLPAVAVDGRVATVRGADMSLVDPTGKKSTTTIGGGAADTWFFARWNGFRPRARGIDEPVSFRTEGIASAAAGDSAAVAAAPPPTPIADTAGREEPPPPPPAAPAAPSRAAGWTVSFARVLTLERAREIAASIEVRGQRPRVVSGEANGTAVFSVVLGPFPSKDEAERLGRSSGHTFWVFEGVP